MRSQDDERKQQLAAELARTLLEIAQSRHHLVTQKLLARVKAEWQSVPDICRPWGYWIREYDSLPADADSVDFLAVPQQVWFYDTAGLRPESVWKWMRSVAVRTLAPSVRLEDNFPFGMTAFAPYVDSEDYYLEVLWAGRYGRAWRVRPGANGRIVAEKELWIA